MPSLKSGRGNSEVQREVKLGGTTSFKHEPPRSSQPEMNKELPKEQVRISMLCAMHKIIEL